MKTTRRSVTRTVAVALVAVVALTACESDPSAKRVAQDLVKTLTQDQPEVQDCMLKVIDGYSTDELDAIGSDAAGDDKAKQDEATKALDKFQADLEACGPAPVTTD